MIEIRNAGYEDAALLADIMIQSFRTAFSDFISWETILLCTNEENCRKMMEGILEAGQMHVYIASCDKIPYGELFWSDGEGENEAEIVAIHSRKESWGSGIGAAMLEYALQEMRRAGKLSAYLWAFEKNARARRFYGKNGFRTDGEMRKSEFDGAMEIRYYRELKESIPV